MPSTTLTVKMDQATKRRFAKLAKNMGRSRSSLAADAIDAYLDVSEWQVVGIKRAILSLDAGCGIPHEEVDRWVRSLGKRKELPRPRP
jgi:RHH-type transcriptional regulator, rel operon repressor / antitoxin RelB